MCHMIASFRVEVTTPHAWELLDKESESDAVRMLYAPCGMPQLFFSGRNRLGTWRVFTWVCEDAPLRLHCAFQFLDSPSLPKGVLHGEVH